MRVPQTPEASELPPPPYSPSASAILTPQSSEDAEPFDVPTGPITDLDQSRNAHADDNHVHIGTNASAIDYFTTRPFARGEILQNEGVILNFLTRPINFLPSTKKDEIAFPEPIETFFNRDVTFKDWNVFKDHLLPQNATSFENEKATFILTPSQQEHVRSVVADWNKGFFRPRRISIEPVFDASTQATSTMAAPIDPQARRLRRSGSMSSVASSASRDSSVSSISSIDSNDFESVPPATIRDLLTSIHSDPSKKQHLRIALEELRADFRSKAEAVPPEERKKVRRDFKREHRELGREIRKIVREARQQQREERKALRRSRKEARRASRHNTFASQADRSLPPVLSHVNASASGVSHPAMLRTQTDRSFNTQVPSLASSSRAPTTASEQQRRKGLLGSAVDTLNQFAKVCEDACDLGEKHAVEVAKRLDVMIEEGERKLRGTSF